MAMAMHTILFDDFRREQLLPLTFTRPVSMIRVGILTICEKWELALKTQCFQLTADYLSKKFPLPKEKNECLLINGGVLPSVKLIQRIIDLNINEGLYSGTTLVAAKLPDIPEPSFFLDPNFFEKRYEVDEKPLEILNPWDIFRLNGLSIEADFEMITKGRRSQSISKTNSVLNSQMIFVEEGAKVECAVLNAQTGPIYIGANSEVMEGSLIRGPFALCEHSTLKLGAKIYGPTTVGPYSKVGGEVNNSVFFANSNKAHDGFMGNSVIGEWCNIGADTNTSNLKNNYANVKLWSYIKKGFVDTGLQFCGLIMGDHSKCGINTMFNTGTVVGVSANIFGDGFPRNFIPSFSWGGAQGFTVYNIDKALETAQKVFARRGKVLEQVEIDILTHLFELTAPHRH